MQTSYSSIRSIASILKGLGYLCLVADVLILMFIMNEGEKHPYSIALYGSILVSLIIGAVTLFIISGIVILLSDIADNTRRSAEALENRAQ